jgi:HlyD family secretion protein
MSGLDIMHALNTMLRDRAARLVGALRRRSAPVLARLEKQSAGGASPVVTDAVAQAAHISMARHVRAIALIAVFLIGSIGILGAATRLAGAVIAAGSLVVESSVKRVQHPTGGVVGELLVHDGSRVEAGDVLVRLDPTEAQANLAAVTKTLWELKARRARLEVERDGGNAVVFPDDLSAAAEGDRELRRLVAGESRLFDLRAEALRGQKAQLRERITQLREEVSGLSEQAAAKAQEIEFVKKELGGVRDLYEKSLVPISRLTALERDAARLAGERGLLIASTAQTRGKISEIELQIIQLDQNRRSEVARELADIRAKTAELTEKQVTAAEQLKRIDIRAPQAGIVHQLSVHAKGAVIAAAEQIMLIVPGDDALIVEAKVMPADIDKIAPDQHATLRFTSFNRQTTPELSGSVDRIAADTIKDDHVGAYYLVRVRLDAGEIRRLGAQRLIAGMPVEVFIKTQDRSMLSYILKPLLDQASRAFRES